ncbi:MAG: penicillin-binding transpeptidase domain-containing protein, partial [Anaerolineae bacterium]
PITYAAAFDPAIVRRYGYRPLTPATMMMDTRTAFLTQEGTPYVPQNYDHQWRGPVLLRQALASSYNLVAVKVLDYAGLEAMTGLARSLGITTFDNAERFGLALTLGGGEVKLLELTAAYAAFANDGRRVEPFTIARVTDAAGNTFYRRQPEPGGQAIDPRAAYLITDILSDNFARAGAFGEGSPLRLSRPAAAKTGTTTDFRDNWTIGYTPDFAVGVWAGNADNEPMRHVSGITGAAPIWRDVMAALHQTLPPRDFARPAGLVTATVCAVNGLLPSEGCRTIDELFIAGTEPTRRDDWHRRLAIDRRNGLLAGSSCPPEQTVERWFTLYPPDAQAWVAQNHTRQAPETYSPLCPPGQGRQSGSLTAIAPADGSPIRFLSPDQGAVYRLSPAIPAADQRVRVAVRLAPDVDPASVHLRINGQLLARGTETLWQLSPGRYLFEAVGVNSRGEVVRTSVEVGVNE